MNSWMVDENLPVCCTNVYKMLYKFWVFSQSNFI